MTMEEIFERAKAAANPEEIIEIAKENGRKISIQNAEEIFNSLHQTGELSDDEISNAAAGCNCGLLPQVIHNDCLCFSNSWFQSNWECRVCGCKAYFDVDTIVTEKTRKYLCSHMLELGTLNCDTCKNLNGNYCFYWGGDVR